MRSKLSSSKSAHGTLRCSRLRLPLGPVSDRVRSRLDHFIETRPKNPIIITPTLLIIRIRINYHIINVLTKRMAIL